MKSLELELKERLFIVEGLNNVGVPKYDLVKSLEDSFYLKLELLGLGSELTEDIAKELVPNELGFLFDGEVKEYFLFPDYKKNNHPFKHKSYKSALDSFISAIEAKGWYWGENPEGKTRPQFNDYSSLIAYKGDCDDWDKAEEKTFHPEKCLIFKIVE